jgi:hypothetical protein
MSKLISKLPNEIKKKALNYNVTKTNDLVCAFDWSETREGWEIWNEIYKGNYDPFYNYYSMKQTTPKQWCEEKGYNEYHVMIIEQYLNDIGK